MVSRPPAAEEEGAGLATRLRDFLLARVQAGARVLLLAREPELSAALEAAGCAVREVASESPASAASAAPEEALERFAPTHVVLPVHALGALEAWLGVLRRRAPEAEVLFGFWNAGASAALLATLRGQAPGRAGPSDVEVARTLEACGFQVRHREALPAASGARGLAVPAEAALRQLLNQLSPSAEADLLLYAVAPGPSVAAAPLVPGLLSVVVWAGSPGRPGLLDETLFSLACQEQHPLELVLALGPEARPSAEATRELLERYRRLGGFQLQLVEGDAPGLLDEALRRTRGQYVAFLEAGGVVYPAHYVRLVAALQRGEEAWAVARAFRATCRPGRPGEVPFIESKCPFPLGEHLETTHLLQEPELLQALVIDRFRVEPLPLAPVSPEEGLAPLPLRLAALFEPIFLAEGIATCEVRSFPVEGPPATREPPALQVLGSLSSLEARLSRAKAEGASTRALRYRLVDGLDARVRKRLPWLYSALRSAARRLR